MTSNGDEDDHDDDRAVYVRYHPIVLKFLLNKVPSGTREEANELAAIVFLRFFEKRAKGPLVDKNKQPIRLLKPYLLGIARRVLLERLRDLAKGSSDEEIEEQSVADLGRSFSSQLSIAERRSCIQECMRMLPLYEQLVIESVIHQEMTYLEVAQLLGVPLGTVATHYSRGRKHLEALYLLHCPKGGPGNAANGTNGAALRRAYPWYDASAGTIDDRKLLAAATREHAQALARIPEWYAALEVPRALPDATLTELSTLARSVWHAWHLAGHPGIG